MKLSDRMLYHGIRTSRRMAKLTFFERDFFYGLINVADELGRFEVDVEILRATLYAPMLSKVTATSLSQALEKFQSVKLVKIWSDDDGREYGEVYNYRQTRLRNRSSSLPPPPWDTPSPPSDISTEGRKEGSEAPQSPRSGGGPGDFIEFSNLSTATTSRYP